MVNDQNNSKVRGLIIRWRDNERNQNITMATWITLIGHDRSCLVLLKSFLYSKSGSESEIIKIMQSYC